MAALDIFNSNAFSMVSLTDTINKLPFLPGRIGQLGIFHEQGVATTTVLIEEKEGWTKRLRRSVALPSFRNSTPPDILPQGDHPGHL